MSYSIQRAARTPLSQFMSDKENDQLALLEVIAKITNLEAWHRFSERRNASTTMVHQTKKKEWFVTARIPERELKTLKKRIYTIDRGEPYRPPSTL